jgi:hypothetical protein
VRAGVSKRVGNRWRPKGLGWPAEALKR